MGHPKGFSYYSTGKCSKARTEHSFPETCYSFAAGADGASAQGKKREKMVPWWTGCWVLRKVRRPWWRFTIPAEIQRPRPVPLRSCGVERLEEAGAHLGRHAVAGIGDGDADAFASPDLGMVGCVVGANDEASALAHGVDGIGDQIIETWRMSFSKQRMRVGCAYTASTLIFELARRP